MNTFISDLAEKALRWPYFAISLPCPTEIEEDSQNQHIPTVSHKSAM